MKSKELLFELIHSLTKSEKRYFKVFTSAHKESNNYIKLFNAIQDQKKYNEDSLLKSFKNEDFVRQFSVAKNYLMNLILKSLSQHHQKAKKSIELNEYITEIEVLYWKGLYKLAHKKINQAKKIALKYNMAHYLLMINYWDRRIEDYISSSMHNEDIVTETKIYLEEYNQQMEMSLLIKKMQKITRGTIKITSQSSNPVLEIFSHELMLLNEKEITNFYTKVDYFLLKGIGNAILGKQEEEFKYKMRLLEFLEENPHQIKENPLRYSSALNNILLYYYFKGYPKEYPKYLAKLDHVELKFHHERAVFYDTKYNLAIGYYLHLRDDERIKSSLIEMEKWYKSTASLKSTQAKMICEYNMALAHFSLKENKAALRWCNSGLQLFDMKVKRFRHDLAVSILMIQVLIYFDLTHFELAIRNLALINDIAKKNKYNKSEMDVLQLIKTMVLKESLSEYINELKNLIENQDASFTNLDKDVLLFWIDTKGVKL